MLQQFTWQQFLVAISVLTLIWYGLVILIYFRKELKAILTGKSEEEEKKEPLPHRWQESYDPVEQEAEDHLMGKAKLPEGVSILEMEQVRFVDEDNKMEVLGLVSDVIEEIKAIFNIIVKEDGSKKDFFKLIASVKESYSGIIGSQHIHQINEYIITHASFHITHEELENLW